MEIVVVGTWGYFVKFCLDAKVRLLLFRGEKWSEKTGKVWHSEYISDGQNLGS